MPRNSRERSSSGIYHIILRGVNRQIIFEDDEDRYKFLGTLGYYKEISKYEVYAYCLMSNHVHILIKESADESISVAIKRISSSYVYWYNDKYMRCGHLFQERFKSEAVENQSYFLTVLRYIHQNPIKAATVKSVSESKWTSYKEYINNADLVDTDFALEMFANNVENKRDLFVKFMNEDNNDECLENIEIVRVSDEEVMDYISRIGIVNVNKLQQLDKESRDENLRKLKRIKGVTLKQLSRVTGISRNIIERA